MASAPTPKRKAVCSNHIGDASAKTKPGRSMNPPGLVFSIESAAAALTPALPRRGAGFLRQGFAAFGAGRQGRRRYNTSPQPVLPVPVTKEPRVLCPAGDASGSAAWAAQPQERQGSKLYPVPFCRRTASMCPLPAADRWRRGAADPAATGRGSRPAILTAASSPFCCPPAAGGFGAVPHSPPPAQHRSSAAWPAPAPVCGQALPAVPCAASG